MPTLVKIFIFHKLSTVSLQSSTGSVRSTSLQVDYNESDARFTTHAHTEVLHVCACLSLMLKLNYCNYDYCVNCVFAVL